MPAAITKAALAAELGVTPQAVSAYVRDGLPVRRDGRLDRAEALTWIGKNRHLRINTKAKGAIRARALISGRTRPAEHNDNPVDLAVGVAVRSATVMFPARAALAAQAAGLSAPAIRAVFKAAIQGAQTFEDRLEDLLGIAPEVPLCTSPEMFLFAVPETLRSELNDPVSGQGEEIT
jgi:hypothetical protein